MSDDTPAATAATATTTGRPTRRFRPARVAMDRDAAARQGRIAQAAFVTLGQRDAAMAFLNTHDDTLGGRPIDAAVASDEGMARAEQALARRTGSQSPAPEAITANR